MSSVDLEADVRAVERARRWLETVEPAAPEALHEKILAAVAASCGDGEFTDLDVNTEGSGSAGESDGSVAPVFVAAALEQLQSVMTAGSNRETAYDLLVIDALLTYAIEAAAEEGADALSTITAVSGPEGLARRLPGS